MNLTDLSICDPCQLSEGFQDKREIRTATVQMQLCCDRVHKVPDERFCVKKGFIFKRQASVDCQPREEQ